MRLQFEDFTNSHKNLNGNHNASISRLDLCRCTMQVGYKYSSASLYKCLQLFFMIMANVKEGNGELLLKDAFYYLDQSEKVGVSYQIAQGLTKAVAEKYLQVPWLAHFKALKSDGCHFAEGTSVKKVFHNNVQSGAEPDLVGYDQNGNPHVFESKGSSLKNMRSDTIQKAVNQVSRYTSIIDAQGIQEDFITRCACLFNFEEEFHGRIIDPSMDGDDAGRENGIGFFQCLYEYYFGFFSGRDGVETVNEFHDQWLGYAFSFNGQRFFWGIRAACFEFLDQQLYRGKSIAMDARGEEREERIKNVLDYFREERVKEKVLFSRDVSVGNDGCVVFRM